MMQQQTRNIKDIVETLKQGKGSNRKCTLLIGAGCSVSAGIPLASGFVEYIKEHFPSAYERAKQKNYPHLMAELGIGQRRDIIAKFVDDAKINWAHIAIAQLMKSGFVDRVLTTNFDPLIMRACALVGVFPAIYDFAASQTYKPADIPDQAIFHLHGQRSGFKLLHTEEEVASLTKELEPVFQDAGQGRTWIVVGYSGENDPVFEHLAKVHCYDYNFYWVGYKDHRPGKHVIERLCVKDKQAYHVSEYDADGFFVELSKELECFPPNLIGKPFTHLLDLLGMLSQFPLPGQDVEIDVTAEAQLQVEKAIERYEEGISSTEAKEEQKTTVVSALAMEATEYLLAGEYKKVIEIIPKDIKEITGGLIQTFSWANLLEGNDLIEQAKTKEGEEADTLFELAGEKFQQALEIKPDKHEALNSWGIALNNQAKTKDGEEADKLYELAGEKYQQALEIKPDKHDALNNWGIALGNQAKTKEGEEADRLFELAGEKYQQALDIKPDKHQTLNNWGIFLGDQAKIKEGEEADKLYELGGEKYQQALEIKPDKHDALNNWGSDLSDQAKTKEGEEADRLFELAGEKYQQALEIKPDKHEVLHNWGNDLIEYAKMKTGELKEELLNKAKEKCMQANEIIPGYGAYNLACIFSLLGDLKQAFEWIEESHKTGHLPSIEHIAKDSDLDNLRSEKDFIQFLEDLENNSD